MTNTEYIVMKRVRRIYVLRQYINRTTLKLYAGGILMGALTGLVSVSNILANMPSLTTPGMIIDFVVRAIVDTEFVVQILFAGFLTAIVLTLYDISKNMLQNKVIFAQL